MINWSTSAVIVGCLPPFKLLFKDRGSFRRSKSPIYYKNMSPGLHHDAIRLGSAGTVDSIKAAPKVKSRSIDGDQRVSDGRYGGGHGIPCGAVGVRSEYVSRTLGPCEKS